MFAIHAEASRRQETVIIRHSKSKYSAFNFPYSQAMVQLLNPPPSDLAHCFSSAFRLPVVHFSSLNKYTATLICHHSEKEYEGRLQEQPLLILTTERDRTSSPLKPLHSPTPTSPSTTVQIPRFLSWHVRLPKTRKSARCAR